jgi:hypothetical protein
MTLAVQSGVKKEEIVTVYDYRIQSTEQKVVEVLVGVLTD